MMILLEIDVKKLVAVTFGRFFPLKTLALSVSFACMKGNWNNPKEKWWTLIYFVVYRNSAKKRNDHSKHGSAGFIFSTFLGVRCLFEEISKHLFNLTQTCSKEIDYEHHERKSAIRPASARSQDDDWTTYRIVITILGSLLTSLLY